MKKKLVLVLTAMALIGTIVTGCTSTGTKQEAEKVESEVKEEVEKVESEVKEEAERADELGNEFVSKLQNDLVNIEATASNAIEAGEKDITIIEEEAVAAIKELKEAVERDAGDAKNEALNLVSSYEERIQRLF